MPLQLSQASSCSEVWARSPNAGDAGRPNQKATDVPRCLHVRPELFVLGQDRLCVYLRGEFARSGILGDFRGYLTTLDCGSTLLVQLEREFRRDERRIVLKENPKLKPYLPGGSGRERVVAKLMRKLARSKNAIILIAEAGSEPVGFSTVSIELGHPISVPRRFGFIGYMFVRHQYRGQSTSSLMMKEALAWLAKRKIKHVCLSVIKDNKRAHAIWAKWGFYDFYVFTWKLD